MGGRLGTEGRCPERHLKLHPSGLWHYCAGAAPAVQRLPPPLDRTPLSAHVDHRHSTGSVADRTALLLCRHHRGAGSDRHADKNAIVLLDEIQIQLGDCTTRYDGLLTATILRVRPV